jgi:hypothetical protein
MVHPSVLSQTIELPQLMDNVNANPSLVASLLEIEEIFKTHWPYDPGQSALTGDEAKSELKSQEAMKKSLGRMVKKAENRELKTEVMVDEGGRPRYTQSWLGSIIHELMG